MLYNTQLIAGCVLYDIHTTYVVYIVLYNIHTTYVCCIKHNLLYIGWRSIQAVYLHYLQNVYSQILGKIATAKLVFCRKEVIVPGHSDFEGCWWSTSTWDLWTICVCPRVTGGVAMSFRALLLLIWTNICENTFCKQCMHIAWIVPQFIQLTQHHLLFVSCNYNQGTNNKRWIKISLHTELKSLYCIGDSNCIHNCTNSCVCVQYIFHKFSQSLDYLESLYTILARTRISSKCRVKHYFIIYQTGVNKQIRGPIKLLTN